MTITCPLPPLSLGHGPSATPLSFAPPGRTNTASIASSSRGLSGRCGTVIITMRVAGELARTRFASENASVLPFAWSRASMKITSGCSVAARAAATSRSASTPMT